MRAFFRMFYIYEHLYRHVLKHLFPSEKVSYLDSCLLNLYKTLEYVVFRFFRYTNILPYSFLQTIKISNC